MKRRIISFLLAFALVFALLPAAALFAEDTDAPDTLADAQAVNVGEACTDNIADKKDQDCFKFKLPAAGALTIEFSHPDLGDAEEYWVANLYSGSEDLICSYSFRGSGTEESSYTVGLPKGTYYIRFIGGNPLYGNEWRRFSTEDYTFCLVFTATNTWEKENNGSTADATKIKVNDTVSGSISSKTDTDFFLFTLSKDMVTSLTFTRPDIGKATECWQAYLYDNASQELGTYAFTGNEESTTTEGIALKKGTYTVRISWNLALDEVSTATYTLSVHHAHSYTSHTVTPPTCTEKGYTTHLCECGYSYKDTEVAALGHKWDGGTVTTQPTMTEVGIRTYVCTRCGVTSTEEIPPLSHVHSYTVVVTAPTCTKKGFTTHTCSCGDSYVDSEVKALGHNYIRGACTRCGAKDPNYTPVSFSDVTASSWFYEAVDYAVAKGLMNGVGDNRFAPDDPMTRAMLVTVLWRYEGSPIDGYNNFTDVPSGQWYSDAVAWAVKYGIVNGITPIQFSPNGNITREQMAAILYRYAQTKGYDTSKPGSLSGFPDRAKVSDYALQPIAWAVGAGIIGGSDGQLLPQGNATRAQVATILMRFIEGASAEEPPVADTEEFRVALITDFGDITDKAFNQATYEGCRAWCEDNRVGFNIYRPSADSDEERVKAIKQAVKDGYTVLLLPGYAHAGAIVETCELYPDVKFIALDVNDWDFQDAAGHSENMSWKMPSNVFSALYHEELAGYMAGYAAVKLGYRRLGFLGGMAVPAVVRYGYGFLQGADQAAKELSIPDKVSVKYVYGNQFYGDPDITAYTDTWYATGTEVVFACGGGIYTSAAEAAAKVGGKVIGVDVDQAPTIDAYGKGMTVTSAMKNLGQTVHFILSELKNGKWSSHGGKIETLGLVSEDPAQNFVGLPDSTQWYAGGFTKPGYEALVKRLFKGELKVSASIDVAPALSISVDYQGNIK